MKTPLLPLRLLPTLALLVLLPAMVVQAQNPLTNGLVAYWTFDNIFGSALTPDVAGGRDLLPYFGGANVQTNFGANTVEHVPGYRSNAVSMVRTRQASVGYFSSGPADLLPMLRLTNFTMSFWVKSDPAVSAAGNRIFSAGSTTANTIWDIAYEDGSLSTPAVLDHFPRQTQSGTFAELNGQHYKGTPNAVAFDNTWHNITVVSKTVTNLDAPVISSTTYDPFSFSATIIWSSATLDSLATNAFWQMNTNQNYLVQKADALSGPWATIAEVGSGGAAPLATQTYTDINATNPAAFYRVVKPGIRRLEHVIYVDRTNRALENVNSFLDLMPGIPQSSGNVYRRSGSYNANTMGFGALLRGASGVWGTCQIDDAAVWNRALSDAEIAQYIADGITNVFPEPPLVANLASEFPAVVANQSVRLNWTGSRPPATLALYPGPVDVTPQSVLGIGNTNVVLTADTTFDFVVSRGGSSLTSSVPVRAVSNVAAGWRYLDSFTFLSNGDIGGQGSWENPLGGAATQNMQPLQVHTAGDGNKVISFNGFDTTLVTGNGGVAGRKLLSYSSQLGQSNTLFFRFYLDSTITNINLFPYNVDIHVGLSDKGILDQAFLGGDHGPAIRLLRQNQDGPIDLQAQNGPAAMDLVPQFYSYVNDAVNGDTNGLIVDKIYNVWIDIQNIASGVEGGLGSGGAQTNGDRYVVYLQREDWPARTNLFSGIVNTNNAGTLDFGTGALISSRDMSTASGQFPPDEFMDNMFVCMPSGTSPQGTNTVRFDDFFISTPVGPNPTVPVPAGSFVAP